MARLSFKDVGIQNSIERSIVASVAPTPFGIKTPLELDEGNSVSIFKMNYSLLEQMSDNLRNIILTLKL